MPGFWVDSNKFRYNGIHEVMADDCILISIAIKHLERKMKTILHDLFSEKHHIKIYPDLQIKNPSKVFKIFKCLYTLQSIGLLQISTRHCQTSWQAVSLPKLFPIPLTFVISFSL